MKVRWLIVLIAFVCGVAHADGVTWDSLSDEQQQVLNAFADGWDQLPADRQQRLATGAQRWSAMSASERDARRSDYATARNVVWPRRVH